MFLYTRELRTNSAQMCSLHTSLSSDSPGARCYAGALLEACSEVAGVAKTARDGDLPERQARAAQQLLRERNPPLQDVLVGRLPDGCLEGAQKMIR